MTLIKGCTCIIGILFPILLLLLWQTCFIIMAQSLTRISVCFAIALIISIAVYRKKFLNRSGAICVFFCGFAVMIACITYAAACIAFLYIGSKITNLGKDFKKLYLTDYKDDGQRNWVQVLANGGPATILALLQLLLVGSLEPTVNIKSFDLASLIHLAVLSALSCATGDTFASELGPVYARSSPRCILKPWKKVPHGVNGGVTLEGTLFAGLGGLLIGSIHFIFTLILNYERNLFTQQIILLPLGAIAGIIGSTIDSLLGSYFQFSGIDEKTGKITNDVGPNTKKIIGYNILDNCTVNLLSTLITAFLVPFLLYRFI